MVRKSLRAGSFLVLCMSVPAFAQYMTTPPPDRTAPAQPPAGAVSSDSLTLTGKNGQSEQQQWADRYECHKWAKDQSGFDPTLRSPSGMTGEEINSHRDQYRRAFTACLEGRGYSVQYGQPAPARPAAAAEPVTSRHWVRSSPELRYRPIEGQISGGYTATVGTADHELDDGSSVGFGLAWFPTSALPLGIRVDGSYSSFRARDALLAQFGPNFYHGWQDVYGGDVDLQLDLAHSSSRSKLYLLGGAGWYRERSTLREIVYGTGTFCGFSHCETGTFPFKATDHETTSWRSSWNAGLGWEMAYADGASFFVEARYRQITPSNDKLEFVPITVGLRF
jgi:opacity protein-like surface antigen